jgi:regulator of sigma E protease
MLITTIVSFIVLLAILIFVHELGHFLAAKLLGVRVEKFSLGFPPKMFSRKVGETVYQICWIPLGGFVSLLGEQPGDEIPEKDQARSLSHKPYWVKSTIVLAGVTFNIIFAFFVLWILSWIQGIPHLSTTSLGPIKPESPLAQAGLQIDDVIVSIDGTTITYYDDIEEKLAANQGETVAITVTRNGTPLSVDVTPKIKEGTNLLGEQVEIWDFGFVPRIIPIIGEVPKGKPAAEAGVLPGDLVVSLNGTPVKDWDEVAPVIRGTEEEPSRYINPDGSLSPVILGIERDGVPMEFTIIPVPGDETNIKGEKIFRPLVGIAVEYETVVERVGPIRALSLGTATLWNFTKLTVLTVGKLIQTKVSLKAMGGPILIAQLSGQMAERGLGDFFLLMAIISINLAIINMVPLPILDGGQFVIFTIEAIKRSPISLKARVISQWVGMCAVAALIILVVYNDIARIATKPKPPTQIERTE